jgi:hypothetical protein
MVTIAMDDDMLSPKTVATEATATTGGSVTSLRSHCRNRSHDTIAKVGPPPVATDAFCSSDSISKEAIWTYFNLTKHEFRQFHIRAHILDHL